MRRLAAEAVRRVLRAPEVVQRAAGSPAAVALTFDDGPSAWTSEVADALEAHRCRGTFFLLGAAVEQRPQTVAALAAAGHELGSHLFSHADPARQSRATLRAEIDRTADAIERAGGGRPTLVRPPYCGAPAQVARAAARSGIRRVVLRSVDPEDWRAGSAEEIVESVLAAVRPGDIVCLHDGLAPNNRGTDSRAATAAAVRWLVPALLRRNLQPVTVSQLLG